jgi:ribosome-binding ATPase YchF (GTP1/OBG family)
MRKVTEKKQSGGKLNIFEDDKKGIFLAEPHGIINPSLLREDLEQARTFANRLNKPWMYVTNTEDVKLVNPFNLMYLKEVKKIKNLQKIVIFVPNPINYLLIKLSSFIVQPDKLITKRSHFEKLIEKGS